MERVEHLRHLSDEIIANHQVERRTFGREAVRAVIFDENQRVALLFIGKRKIYKLPGGGIDGDEDLSQALRREVCEETGQELSNVVKLGIVTEDRAQGDMFQISHCYLAVGQYSGEPHFTSEETADGFSLYWADNLQEAIKLVGSNESEVYDDKYIKERDSAILSAAQDFFEKQADANTNT